MLGRFSKFNLFLKKFSMSGTFYEQRLGLGLSSLVFTSKNKRRCKNMKGIKREFLQDYLNEYMWRDNIVEDCFEKTLELIRDFYE